MAVNKIIKMGNPVLRKVATKFTIDEIKLDSTKQHRGYVGYNEAAGGIDNCTPNRNSQTISRNKHAKRCVRYPDNQESEEFIIFNPSISYLPSDKRVIGRVA